jgi:hypothetical protein
MTRSLLALSLALLLAACSSPYKMAPEVARLSQEMSPQQAAEVLAALMSNREFLSGVASSTTLHVPVRQTVIVDPAGYTMTVRERTYDVRIVGTSAQTTEGTGGEEVRSTFSFESLKRVSIAENQREGLMGVINCAAYAAEHCVQFWHGRHDAWIAVDADDLNRFLAAVQVLAPEARIVE